MELDYDKCLENLQKGIILEESEFKKLCVDVKAKLFEESNVASVDAPVIVCGDIHGQFYDLMKLFEIGGKLPENKYIFLGDYVDRGQYSIEVFTLLMLYKVKYPDRITILRGNHECRQVTRVYGFYEECMQKYGTANVWKMCTEVFDLLNVAALIGGKIFCVHGGLSPFIRTIDHIRSSVKRNQEIPHEGAFCDMMWSDPDDAQEGLTPSMRGAGYIFGKKPVDEFNRINNINLIARAHQLVMQGYEYHFDKKLVTVWSAPNYCGRCNNIASIMKVDETLAQDFTLFEEVRDIPNEPQKRVPSIFH